MKNPFPQWDKSDWQLAPFVLIIVFGMFCQGIEYIVSIVKWIFK